MPTAAASAPLPPPADEPFKSQLWGFKATTEKAQERVHRLAAYEEEAVLVLESGERLDEAVLKSIGVGESVMEKLGSYMHPDFREQLDLRAKKMARARQFHEMDMPEAAKRLRAEVAAGIYETVAVEGARKPVRLRPPQEQQVKDQGMSL